MKGHALNGQLALGITVLAAAIMLEQASAPQRHRLVVTFDYDFSKTPACTSRPSVEAKPEKKERAKSKTQPGNCVDQFNVYDVSNGTDAKNKYFLFKVELPQNPQGYVKGISGSAPMPNFQPGKHKIGVSAHSLNGEGSDMGACWVIVDIKPADLLPISERHDSGGSSDSPESPPGQELQSRSPRTSQSGPSSPHC